MSNYSIVGKRGQNDSKTKFHSINKKSCNKEYTYTNKSYPEGFIRELVRYKVPDNCNTHNEFTYIMTIPGEVVYATGVVARFIGLKGISE